MMIEGWQLADRQQTLFFDIKRLRADSHFHAYSVSLSLSRSFSLSSVTRTPPHMHTQTQQRTFPLILLPKLKDLEGLTHRCTNRRIHTDIYLSTKKSWIKFRQPLSKPTLRDTSTSFRCDSKMTQNIFPPIWLASVKRRDLIYSRSYTHTATDTQQVYIA